MWGQKAPSKHENGGKKRPQNHKVGAESAPAQIRAEKSVGAKSAVKMQKWGQKAPSKQQSDGKKRHHSDKREKSHGGGKCHQNESSPNLCVNSSSSYISPSMLPLSSGDLIEWSLVCHSILSYQKFCD